MEDYPSNTAYVAAALVASKEGQPVKEPRCPTCRRKQAEWVLVGQFTCPECKTHFIIGSGFVVVLT